jgi:DNA-binding CsgD family transcriptional regulator
MFDYQPEELLGRSLEMLYPTQREYIDIGERWLEVMRYQGECGDDRIMRCKQGDLVWFRVKGRCRNKRDPFSLVACTFESLRMADGISKRLTPREREIIGAIGAGLTSKEIARSLKLSPRTIEMYRSRLMEKAHVRNSSELLMKVLR